VIEKVSGESYEPLFKALAKHPRFKFSLHVSGVLLEWYRDHRPQMLKSICAMVERGQVEIVSGGFFEPIMPAIPRRDRMGQIKKYQKTAKALFGVRPKGLWIAERVWEPELASDFAEAGIEYTLLDDRHLAISGIDPAKLDQWYATEHGGAPLKIFPINSELRFLIPFKPVDQIRSYFEGRIAKGAKAAFYFDDGEKFGSWPGTSDWVYEKGWFEKFFDMIDSMEGRLEMATYGEAAESLPSGGVAYPPSASYSEMEDWALTPQSYVDIQSFRKTENGGGPSRFVRGAVWKNFLVKYPESNRMHKAMLRLSGELEEASSKIPVALKKKLVDSLYAAQCNDAYWHGVFGGLYLPHLRQEIWSRLCDVKKYLNRSAKPGLSVVETPLEREPRAAVFDSPHVSAAWAMRDTGVLTHFLFLDRRLNLLNTLARHSEGYHVALGEKFEELKKGMLSHMEGELDVPAFILAGLAQQFKADPHERAAFMEVIYNPSQKNAEEIRPLTGAMVSGFSAEAKKGVLTFRYRTGDLAVEKRIEFLPKEGFAAHYRVTNASKKLVTTGFGVEINFYLAVSELYVNKPGEMTFRDGVSGTEVTTRAMPGEAFWTYPVMTRHLSEQGLNNTYQGTCVLPHWTLSLKPGESFQTRLSLTAK